MFRKTPEQLEAKLEKVRSRFTAAQGNTATATDRFDEDGSDKSARALRDARDAEQLAADHVGRAERLLAAAIEHALAETRSALEVERKKLEASIDVNSLTREREPLLKAEIAAFLVVAEARDARRRLEVDIRDRKDRLRDIFSDLGEPLPPVLVHPPSMPSLRVPITERLRAHAGTMPESDPCRAHVYDLAGPAPYRG